MPLQRLGIGKPLRQSSIHHAVCDRSQSISATILYHTKQLTTHDENSGCIIKIYYHLRQHKKIELFYNLTISWQFACGSILTCTYSENRTTIVHKTPHPNKKGKKTRSIKLINKTINYVARLDWKKRNVAPYWASSSCSWP